jgi:acetyl esterase/lipase
MLETAEFTTQDIDCLAGTDRSLNMRLFRPTGVDTCPVVLDFHGGAWTKGAYEECFARDEALARAGIAAASLDFRHGADAYPSSPIDINYAIRWLKANAADLGLDAGRVGATGQSSGGHLSMLAAMRPHDPRYTEIPLPAGSPAVDATLQAVGMNWPVINPLSRYHNALKCRAMDNPPGWVGDIPERHDLYWKTEDTMAEGNPMLILERGEDVLTPPAVWVQGRPDPVHDYRDPNGTVDLNEPDRFLANYRKAGGEIELVEIGQANREDTSTDPQVAFFVKCFG